MKTAKGSTVGFQHHTLTTALYLLVALLRVWSLLSFDQWWPNSPS